MTKTIMDGVWVVVPVTIAALLGRVVTYPLRAGAYLLRQVANLPLTEEEARLKEAEYRRRHADSFVWSW
jgi:membrane protein YqaA with SNARE-associated domain